jgi:hypothetical protein
LQSLQGRHLQQSEPWLLQQVTVRRRHQGMVCLAATANSSSKLRGVGRVIVQRGRLTDVSCGLTSSLAPLAKLCDICVAALQPAVDKLDAARQQGVLQHGTLVAAYLKSLCVEKGQLGRLLMSCPLLFSFPVEQRAGVLFWLLMAVGLTADQAARCFEKQPEAAVSPNCAACMAALARLLAAGVTTSDAGKTGGQLLRELLVERPQAAWILRLDGEQLQQRIDSLLQQGLSDFDLALDVKYGHHLLSKSPQRLAAWEALLQQELGCDPRRTWIKAVCDRLQDELLDLAEGTLRQRARALALVRALPASPAAWGIWVLLWLPLHLISCATVVQAFGKQKARDMALRQPWLLTVASAVWQRNLAVMRMCGVSDLLAAAEAHVGLLHSEWLDTTAVASRLVAQRYLGLSAAEAYERHATDLATAYPERLLFLEHVGLPDADATGWCDIVAGMSDTRFDRWLEERGLGRGRWSAFKRRHLWDLPAWEQLTVEAEHEAQSLRAGLPAKLRRRFTIEKLVLSIWV